MDADSSSKFIGSLTKFLQSLCNGYVEFQRGVELVGHIYLSIDTGEKVDYILHEKVNKNDENSVTFVSNSFHAHPPKIEKEKEKIQAPKHGFRNTASKDTSDDDDIMIVDNKGVPGSTNLGTIPSRGLKRTSSPGSDQRQSQWKPGNTNLSRGPGSNVVASPNRRGPVSTVTSHDSEQHDISMGDMKLEQISADELLSLASQVGEGASTSGPGRGPVRVRRSSSLGDAAGQPVWIKQEAPDESLGGSDTGWAHGRDGQSDSSNSGSNLYPVMMHQSPAAFTSAPVFPGFPSSSVSHHGISPGTSASSSYGNPMTGTSGIDPAETAWKETERKAKARDSARKCYERLKQDPARYARRKELMKAASKAWSVRQRYKQYLLPFPPQ